MAKSKRAKNQAQGTKKRKIYPVFGLPGSGKGTYTNHLVETNECVVVISASAVLKEAMQNDPKIGESVRQAMNDGRFAPDSIVNPLMKEAIQAVEEGKKIVLDGYPRTLNQAEYMLEEGLKPEFVVNLHVDKDTVIRRLLRRRVCPKCGKPYSGDGKCRDCEVPLIKRVDDVEDVIRDRIQRYEEETLPALGHLKRKGVPVITILGGFPGSQKTFNEQFD